MKKLIFGPLLTLALLAVCAGPVFAQDGETTTISGSVQSVTLETDTKGVTTVLVTLADELGETQTVSISAETAEKLGLVTLTDDDGDSTTPPTVTVNETLPETIDIASADLLAGEEEKQHPVGSALADFFGDVFGVDYDTVMGYHEDGTGFGVIAQALWMTTALDGNTEIFAAILDAKKSGDYSAIPLPDGSTPTNWGQFRKAVMDDKDGAKNNLGSVMSGHADKELLKDDAANTELNSLKEKGPDKGEINGNKDNNKGDNGENGKNNKDNNKDNNKNNNKNNNKDKGGKGNGKNK